MGVCEHENLSSQSWKLNIDNGNLEKTWWSNRLNKRYILDISDQFIMEWFQIWFGGNAREPDMKRNQNPLHIAI